MAVVIFLMLLRGCYHDSELETKDSTDEIAEKENLENIAEAETDIETEISDEPEHIHKNNKDGWYVSEGMHWYLCDCGEKFNAGDHDYGEWEILVEATEAEEGRREHHCSVCKYTETVIIPTLSHTHNFSEAWVSNQRAHWHMCDCGERSLYTDHGFGAWITVKEPTCTSRGIKSKKCIICGYEQTDSVSATGHIFKSGRCSVCGVTDGISYTVTFDANGGSVSKSSLLVRNGSTYGSLPLPKRDYYTFIGWYTEKNGGTEVISATVVNLSSNITLYAHWSQNKESDWVLASNIPEGALITDTKWVYDKTVSSWGSYGAWSSWSTTPVSENSSRDVETREVTVTYYKYYRYVNSAGTYGAADGYSVAGCNIYQEITLNYQLTWQKDVGVPLYGPYVYNGNEGLKNVWIPKSVDNVTHTEYRYRERTMEYSTQYGLVSTTEPVSSGEISNVKKYVRYRAK
ncbi:MAG: InlB B-repeat-containing protein [Clostridia bacterium]|nr:InlB B-repeat-containing protein [Clostridia bacterium]